jgi:hypothetical protein
LMGYGVGMLESFSDNQRVEGLGGRKGFGLGLGSDGIGGLEVNWVVIDRFLIARFGSVPTFCYRVIILSMA